MRRWLFWLLIAAFLILVVSRFTEIESLVNTLAQGRWEWVVAAVLLQVIYYVTYAALYQAAFHTVEVESRVRELLPVMFASLFVNVAAPVANIGGSALFVDDAAQRGQSGTRAAAGVVLAMLADVGAFLLPMLVGLIFLFLWDQIRAYQVLGALAVLMVVVGLTALLMIGWRARRRLRRLFEGLRRLVNRAVGWFNRSPVLDDDWAEETAAEFAQAAAVIADHPRRMGRTLAVGLITHLVNMACLYALTVAFYRPMGLEALLMGYAMAITFRIASITPQGAGVAEGVLTALYASLGLPGPKAAAVTLTFRGLSIWLPMVIGFFLLRWVRSFKAQK